MPDSAPEVFVHLLPRLMKPDALRGSVAIVVDVLRATTVMVHALAAGCEAVIPCAEIDEARSVADGLGPGRVLLGGEREGLPIPGFDLGNSPGDYTPEACRGKTVVMTTTNGTRAILASQEADRVLIAAFPNASATVAAARSSGRPVHIVCSGTDGRISLEDSGLAGMLAARLDPTFERLANDEARIVARLWGFTEERLEGQEGPRLRDVLLIHGRGGRRVRALSLEADLLEAAQIDRFPIVAELRRDPLRIVRAPEDSAKGR